MPSAASRVARKGAHRLRRFADDSVHKEGRAASGRSGAFPRPGQGWRMPPSSSRSRLGVLNLCPRFDLGNTSEDSGIGVQCRLPTEMRIQHA
jgi:hypothetical protein